MTPEIHFQYDKLKTLVDIIYPLLLLYPSEELEKMADDFRPWANGTLGIIAMQNMGIQDLHKSEENLSNAIKTIDAILNLKKLIIREVK